MKLRGAANFLTGFFRRKNPSYYFRYSGSECKKLYHYLYDNVPPEQYLERKYVVFNNYFYREGR